MAHSHGHDDDVPLSQPARRLLTLILGPLMAATLIGLVVLWPSGDAPASLEFAADELVDGTVVSVSRLECEGTNEPCTVPVIRIDEGTDKGEEIDLGELSVESGIDLSRGDRVVLGHYPDAGEGFEYSYADRDRKSPLLVLGVLFALAVVVLGRATGLRALLGVVLSLLLLVTFVLPAVLHGENPLAVALVGSSAVAVVAIYLAHGLNGRSSAALAGTLLSLGLVGVLAWVFVGATEMTGLADESAGFLRVTASGIDLRGLVLGGIVIGTLGVLDDVTVTQVAAVWELRQANPRMGLRDLYGAGVRIGRDHIASTVNTLVLAYAGASLPLFLLFTQARQGLVDTVNSEVVAVEVVRTLVGSIGLVASVPITTALVALVVTSTPNARVSSPRKPRVLDG